MAFAGALSAYYVGTVSFESYNLNLAIMYLAMIIVGGVGSVLGSVLGAIVITLLPYVLDQVFLVIELKVAPNMLAGVHQVTFGALDRAVSVVRAARPCRDLATHARGGCRLAVRLSHRARRWRHERVARGRGLEVVYGRSIRAVQGVSLAIEEGQIAGLVGFNGAGKTTTIRAISGFLPTENAAVADGRIRFAGQSIRGKRPYQAAGLGIAVVPERDKVFDTLTVKENLDLALGLQESAARHRAGQT